MTSTSPQDSDSVRLAIVIPAWRARHFTSALASLRDQTDRRFRLYIGDDGSLENLKAIVEATTTAMEVVYHRFPENLGGADLVAHWRRCIELTKNEPWIWLFSDDDIAEPGCVASFYRTLDAGVGNATLLRFNVVVIDEADHILRRPDPHPPLENARELLAAMLDKKGRFWCAPDHIFSREVYVRTGGFVAFPKAMYSDWATWLKFTLAGHVRTLPDALVRFRNHPQGTSSGRMVANAFAAITGLVGFCEYTLAITREISPQRLTHHRRLVRNGFFRVLNLFHSGSADSRDLVATCIKVARRSPAPYRGYLCLYALRIRFRALPGVRQLSRWRYQRRLQRASFPSER